MPLWLQWYIAIGSVLGIGAFILLKKIIGNYGRYSTKKGPLTLQMTSEDDNPWLRASFEAYPEIALAVCIMMFAIGWLPIIIYAAVVNTRFSLHFSRQTNDEGSK